MDRKGQLSNVAFGGDWAERIVPREDAQRALLTLNRAAASSEETDPRTPEVTEALALVAKFARGPILGRAFLKAAAIPIPGVRRMELVRIVATIVSVVGVASK